MYVEEVDVLHFARSIYGYCDVLPDFLQILHI